MEPGQYFASSFQTALVPFAIAYAGGCGLVGAMGYYHITQSVIARRASAHSERAIIKLTLFGAFAAPIFQPATGWLVVSIGWRDTVRVESATVAGAFLLAAVVVPRRVGPRSNVGFESAAEVLRGAWHTKEMRTWVLSTLLASAAVDVFLVYQVPAITRAGLSLGVAAAVAGFRGIAQLAGRLPLAALLGRFGARNTLVGAYPLGVASAFLLLVGGNLLGALVLCLLAGASFGALSSLQGIYTSELVDRRHMGTTFGIQQAMYGVGGAIGPLVGAGLLSATGSYLPLIAVIALAFAGATAVLLLGARRHSHAALGAGNA